MIVLVFHFTLLAIKLQNSSQKEPLHPWTTNNSGEGEAFFWYCKPRANSNLNSLAMFLNSEQFISGEAEAAGENKGLPKVIRDHLNWSAMLRNSEVVGVEVFKCFWKNLLRWWGIPRGSVVKNPPANICDPGSIPGWGRSLGGGNGNPLYYFCLENPIIRAAWRATVHGVTESDMT